MEWMVVGILDGGFVAPNGKEFQNVQVIARVSTEVNESPWRALARRAEQDGYIAELLSHRSKGRWESVIAYELKGNRLEPSESDERILESMITSAHP